MVKKIEEIIAELSGEEQYPVVIERDPRLVVYVDEGFDISDEVVERLNTLVS